MRTDRGGLRRRVEGYGRRFGDEVVMVAALEEEHRLAGIDAEYGILARLLPDPTPLVLPLSPVSADVGIDFRRWHERQLRGDFDHESGFSHRPNPAGV